MSEIKVNKFSECQQCGECCKTPCDIIPENLPPLLEKYDMDLTSFFKKYLIALIIASPKYSDEILMMVPVRVDNRGIRNKKFLADNEYLDTQGACIFLENGKCTIHNLKPFGGKLLLCPKMTGSETVQLPKSQYFAYWASNQQLFEIIFPGYNTVFEELKSIFDRMNYLNKLDKNVDRDNEYNELAGKRIDIISNKLFPLFNNSFPIRSFTALV